METIKAIEYYIYFGLGATLGLFVLVNSPLWKWYEKNIKDGEDD